MKKAGEEQDVRRLRVQAGLPLLPPVSISARTCTLPPYTSLGQAHSTSARHEGAATPLNNCAPRKKHPIQQYPAGSTPAEGLVRVFFNIERE